MRDHQPLVSVVVPFFASERTIAACIIPTFRELGSRSAKEASAG